MTTTNTAATIATTATVKTCPDRIAATVINGILRYNRKSSRENLYNPWTDEKGRTCTTDGFRVFCLPWRPAILEDVETSAIDADRATLAAGLNRICFADLDAGNMIEIPAPDLDAVKAHIAQHKGDNSRSAMAYDLGADLPVANAKYLYDVLRVLPGATWYVKADPVKRMSGCICAVTETGARAAVLPMRVFKDPEPSAEPETAAQQPEPATEEPQQAAEETTTEPAPVALGNGWTVETSAAQAEEEPQQATEPAPASAAEEPAADPSKPWAGSELRGAWWVIRFDAATARTRLTLSHEPTEKAAAYIADAGFWASKTAPGTYTRKLTAKAYRAALALAANLSYFHR